MRYESNLFNESGVSLWSSKVGMMKLHFKCSKNRFHQMMKKQKITRETKMKLINRNIKKDSTSRTETIRRDKETQH